MPTPRRRTPSEPDKGELRRQQVLDAATECFRREGFHGTSIARISQAAGMSPGHIYHYFENKEAIVQAIAKRDESDMAELLASVKADTSGDDVITRMTRHTQAMVNQATDPAHAGLMLELGAEAARNPDVLAILRATDQVITDQFLVLLRSEGLETHLDEDQLRLRMELLATVFNGLVIRSLLTPDLDNEGMSVLIDRLIRTLLDDDASCR